MKRENTGKYEVINTLGEQVRAFVPVALPPKPAIVLNGPLQQLLEAATLALGRLDSISSLLPDPHLFIYSYARKEAVLSSQIEGMQSSLSDLLMYELEESPGVPFDDVDVIEVSNYVAALEHGLKCMRESLPLSLRLIREVHEILLSQGRGSNKGPGEFRQSQNWIGGSGPGKAIFVPPPHNTVVDCMSKLEHFLHKDSDGLPLLVRAALVHLQFETIHPFLDGNGRVGRLLIILLLCHANALHQPLLYLSLYLKRHRSTYYELLNYVRYTGDWETWLNFFLKGVKYTASGAVSTAKRLAQIFEQDRSTIEEFAGRRTGSALRVYDALKKRPLLSLSAVCEETKLSHPTVDAAMEFLTEQGVAKEITGKRRGKVFVYKQYMSILNEEGEEGEENGDAAVC